MVYRKSEMLKKFQHDSDIPKVSIFDYGLWMLDSGFTFCFIEGIIKTVLFGGLDRAEEEAPWNL
jgi:hypothetical protein